MLISLNNYVWVLTLKVALNKKARNNKKKAKAVSL